MQRSTPLGQDIIDDLARRHGFSADAVSHMTLAVLDGNGGMAQFFHAEFSGAGQWMRGGLLMLSDMDNHELKGRVDALCHEISDLLISQPGLLHGGGFQSQASGALGESSLSTPDSGARWWPSELGTPDATGAQNDARYAYFGGVRRLAVKTGDDIRIYDTLDHCIGGISQQQGPTDSTTFTSQHGPIDLGSLPLVSRTGRPAQAGHSSTAPAGEQRREAEPWAEPERGHGVNQQAVILDAIERLGDLKAKGILTDEEFAAKKAELLSRL